MIKHGTMLFAYNSMTAVMLALLILLLSLAFQKNNSVLFALSGLVVGISVLVRLPNLLQAGFVVAIIWYYGFCLKEIKPAVRNSLMFFGGFVVGLLLGLGVFVAINGVDALFASSSRYVGMASDSSSSHGVAYMLSKFVTQTISAVYTLVKFLLPMLIVCTVAVLAVVFVAAKVSKSRFVDYKPSRTFWVIVSLVLIVVSVLFGLFYLGDKRDYSTYMYILGLANLGMGIVCAVIFCRRKPFVSVSMVLCACVSVVLAFGSDNVMNTYFTLFAPIFIGVVLCLYYIFRYGLFEKSGRVKDVINALVKPMALTLAVVLVAASFTVFVVQLLPFTYGPYLNGNGSIDELTEGVNDEISLLRGMKTSPERAAQIGEFCGVMQDDTLQDKEMAVFGYFPLAFSLCDNDNYFDAYWLDLGSVSDARLLQTYQEKSSQGNLPVIVLSKVYMKDIEAETPTSEDKQAVMDLMLTENEYSKFYESENYLIYCPK